MFNKIKFYIFKILQNNRITGFIDLFLLICTVITAIFWFRFDKQELEPLTLIFSSLIGIFAVFKILIVKPNIPKLTFSEYISENKMEASFFMGITFTDIKEVLKIARKEKKGLFLIIYDNKHSTNSQLNYSLGYFTEYEITKRLINENFIQAIVSTEMYDVQEFIPKNYHMENCLLVVFDKQLNIIRQEGVYANPDEGLKRVREDINKINNIKNPNFA